MRRNFTRSDAKWLSLGMSCRTHLSNVSYNRTWWPQLVAALILQHERSAHRAGGGTIGGIMIRRGRTTTFQKRLEITDGPPPDSPTQRLRLRSVARSGRCANGGAVVNTRGAPTSAPRLAIPLPD